MVENNLDLLAVTETWLSAEHDESDITSALTPSGYTFIHTPRKGRIGGGVGTLLKDNITRKVNASHSFKTFECQEMILTFPHQSVRLCVIQTTQD